MLAELRTCWLAGKSQAIVTKALFFLFDEEVVRKGTNSSVLYCGREAGDFAGCMGSGLQLGIVVSSKYCGKW